MPTLSLLASILREAIASMRLEAEASFNPSDKFKLFFGRLLLFFAILAATTNFYRSAVLADVNRNLRKQIADSAEICRIEQLKNQTDASSDSQRGSGLRPPPTWTLDGSVNNSLPDTHASDRKP